MSKPESWENVCCRCNSEVKKMTHPGKRACHVTCGPCLYPDNPKCASCEIVGHCRLALDYLKSLNGAEVEKGQYFNEQLTGEETLYHTLSFVDAQQNLVKELGRGRVVVLGAIQSRTVRLQISIWIHLQTNQHGQRKQSSQATLCAQAT